jgi:hypothetical protein
VLVRGQLDVCEGDKVNINDEKVENALEVRGGGRIEEGG